MTRRSLIQRSLRFHFRSHLGVVAGTAIASAAVVGALVVGYSLRVTLRDRALERLASASFALDGGDRVFGRALAGRIAGSERQFDPQLHLRAAGSGEERGAPAPQVVALLRLPAIATRADAAARANQVQVLGVDADFWRFAGVLPAPAIPEGAVVVNAALAARLSLQPGDPLLLRLGRRDALSPDAALATREPGPRALRLRVDRVLSAAEGGDLTLHSGSAPPLNAFVNATELEAAAGLTNTANLMLAGPARPGSSLPDRGALELLNTRLRQNWTLDDADLRLADAPAPWDLELRSPRVFLEDHVTGTALRLGPANTTVILTYLANLLVCGTNAAPYSMVTAAGAPFTPPDLAEDEILINEWLARDLKAGPGDTLALSYFLPESGAQLREATNHFRIRAVVPLAGVYADRSLMPDFPGLEKAETTRDWDAGFPLVYRIRPQDEDYWRQWRGTPKAFISLAAGRKLWANRFGNATAIRFPLPPGLPRGAHRDHLSAQLQNALDPAQLGLRFEPVRERALRAAGQSQDFGQLFLGFSLFLVVAALTLMGLLFQFGLEQRAAEVGTFLALGFTPREVRRLFLWEGAALAGLGAAAGTGGGVLYAQGMLWGLQTLWRDALAGSGVDFHVGAPPLLLGFGASAAIAILTLGLALRHQGRQPAHELLSGIPRAVLAEQNPRRAFWLMMAGGLGALAILGWVIARGDTTNAGAFFGAGALLLLSGLAAVAFRLKQPSRRRRHFRASLLDFSLRNCARRPSRSLATVSLLASACFVILSIGVFRLEAGRDASRPGSGTGGFAFIGESTLPVTQDLNQPAGREFYGLGARDLADARVVPFRVRDGDEASCLNLNRAQQPRLAGVQPERLTGRFTFSKAARGLDRGRGWELLRAQVAADEIPAVGDANSIQWSLGKKVGDTLDYRDEQGRLFKLRLVGAVANSVLQGMLVIDEAAFVKKFPSESGYRWFLISVAPDRAAELAATLSRALQDRGLELAPAVARLNAFNAVQNTYLGAFQILGGLGLLLGSAGLGIVVLRNVLERRGELALLVAVGFRRGRLSRMLLSEHGALLAGGLALGMLAAGLAVLPSLLAPGLDFPVISLGLTLVAVVANGLAWVVLAIRVALRGNLLSALRNE